MISSLSQHTAPSAADLFSRIDTDSDGKVTAAELKADFETHIKKASVPQSGTDTPPAPDFDQMVTDGDSDGDETLDEVEFTTAMQARHNAPPPPPPREEEESPTSQTVEEVVSSLDTNDDGKLSADELLAAYKARVAASQSAGDTTAESSTAPDFAQLVSAIDSDGDELLDTDEITSLLTESRQHRQPPPPPVEQYYAANNGAGEATSPTRLLGQA